MFPTFDLPQQERETVGARRERKTREKGTRRGSTSTTSTEAPKSSASVKTKMSLPAPSSPTFAAFATSEKQKKPAKKSSGFGFFRKNTEQAQGKSEEPIQITTAPEIPQPRKEHSEPQPPPPQPAPIVLSRPPIPHRHHAEKKPTLHIKVSPIAEPAQRSPSLPPPPTPPAKDNVVYYPSPIEPPPVKTSVIFPPTPVHSTPARVNVLLPPSPVASPPAHGNTTFTPSPIDPSPRRPPSRSLPAIPPRRARRAPNDTMSAAISAAREVSDHISSTNSMISVETKTDDSRTACSHMSMLLSPVDFYDDLESEISDSEQTAVSYTDSWSAQSTVTKMDSIRAPPVKHSNQLGTVFEVRSKSRETLEHEAPPRSHPPVAQQSPFARALSKMENAGLRIIATRLSEQWALFDDDEESYQEIMFEKRLWGLTAYQWLMNGKQLQSPSHEMLLASRAADCRRILHLHGSLADGWILAAKYPSATVYSVSSSNSSSPPTTHPAPLNHHSLYVPSISSPLPFPDNYFDVVVSRSVTTGLRNDEWPAAFHDCKRVLKPGAWIEVLALDPRLSRSGPLQTAWADAHIMSRLRAGGLSMLPSDTVLDTMEIVGLQGVRRARIALPAHPPPKQNTATQQQQQQQQQGGGGGPEATRLMAFLGRHLYQDLYGKFVDTEDGEGWFWGNRAMRAECERAHAKMVLTIACAQKPMT